MPGADPLAGHTIGSALREANRALAGAGIEGGGGDARRLLAAVLDLPAAAVLGCPERALGPDQLATFRRHVERRARHEPVSRILGTRDFYGRSFVISPATLDPRPDSETLIEAALEIAREEGWTSAPLGILDVGTGSGCLLLTLLAELPQACGTGSDISAAALEVARHNARRLGLERRVDWLLADALESIAGPFHMLLANLPYVRSGDIRHLDPEVRDFDPVLALDGGADGLDAYRRLVPKIPGAVPNGWVVLEVGHDQADAVSELLTCAGPGMDAAQIRVHRDVSGKRRCVAVKTRNPAHA
jgi:release factor glutamine methyltransferase